MNDAPNDYPLVWMIMGVSGSGKTMIGRLLAERLECDFLEGDRRHPPSNIIKMMSQQPLQDPDRQQWLLAMAADIRQAIDRHRETVITCSALKVSYRHQLTAPGRVQLVWLKVPAPELERRLANRVNHYMKSVMLQSQIATFEAITPEEQVIEINGCLTPEQIVDELLSQAMQRFPDLAIPWWLRGGNPV